VSIYGSVIRCDCRVTSRAPTCTNSTRTATS